MDPRAAETAAPLAAAEELGPLIVRVPATRSLPARRLRTLKCGDLFGLLGRRATSPRPRFTGRALLARYPHPLAPCAYA